MTKRNILHLEELADLREVLVDIEEDSGAYHRAQRWIDRVDDAIADIQKSILTAAIQPTGPSGPPEGSTYEPMPGGPAR